jgi:hypothetical protein
MFSFIETKLFSRLLREYLTDDEYAVLQAGIRVIYYAKARDGIIWMLTIYAKNEEQNIPAHVLRRIKGEIDG